MTEKNEAPSGCSFLFQEVGSETLLIPEDFNDEQQMFARTARDFMEREVHPRIEEMERGDHDVMRALLLKSAEVGFLGIDIPLEYGGLQVDKTTSMLVAENLASYASFATTYSAHTTIGTLPLLYFGTEEQKQKWLPKLATGELLAAYALTEPSSGSDALSAKTRAVLAPDGQHYILDGQKMWITNAGFSDLFTVFCQIDGNKFTAVLVEADREGVSTGAEEKKMGLKGSSTRLLNLEQVKIPSENVLGEIGKGHKIAFNILNIGRFKLGVGTLGAAKRAAKIATTYAKERVAFGQPIASFGAIKAKLGQMLVDLYALESSCYRVAGYMDEGLEKLDRSREDYAQETMRQIEEFAVEDSILKVLGSEVASQIIDEALQIHGGMGYSAELEIERLYRDVRINRIFEGTNEINRMLIPGMILKRMGKGQFNLFTLIQAVDEVLEADEPALPQFARMDHLVAERQIVERAKQLTLYSANQAIQKHMADLRDQQEILMLLADQLIDVYAMDSTVARTLQLARAGRTEDLELKTDATRVLVAACFARVKQRSETLVCHIANARSLDTHLEALAKLAITPRQDTIRLRRKLGEALIERERYFF